MSEEVILVDEQGVAIGSAEKLHAHREGLLHRAFSVLLYNERGEWLLQRRAYSKYHSAGLWSNACCSHPRLHETLEQAAVRRLQEELGIAVGENVLQNLFSFVYRFFDEKSQLWEYEHDTVFAARYDGNVPFAHSEADAILWIVPAALQHWIAAQPDDFSFWFREIVKEMQSRTILFKNPS
ncbi:MAG: isopentenyl-diphosphate Delta-isomerase [Sphingobacteriales bacterium]|nr:isopentenyl-diphosphate Delta-isomerase [Sphingobacteriales bacterium]